MSQLRTRQKLPIAWQESRSNSIPSDGERNRRDETSSLSHATLDIRPLNKWLWCEFSPNAWAGIDLGDFE